MSRIWILLLCLSTSQSFAATEDLASLWTKLLRSNLEIKEAERRVESADALSSAQWGTIFPQVSLESSIDRIKNIESDQNIAAVNKATAIRADQVILDNVAFSKNSIAGIRAQMEAIELDRVKAKLLLDLFLGYYEVLENEAILDTLRESLEGSIRRHEQQAYKVLKAGVRSSREISPLLLDLNQLRLSLRRTESNVREARTKLSLLVNEPIGELKKLEYRSGLTPRPLPEPKPLPEEKLESLQLALKEAEISQVNAKFWPTLSLYGTWSLQSASTRIDYGSLDVSRKSASSIGLILSVPLWSGLSTFHERKAVLSERERAVAQIQASQISRKTFRDDGPKLLREDFDRFQEAAGLASIAEELLRIVQRQEAAGLASFDAILGPELQVLQSTLVRTEAYFNYYKDEAIELSRRGALDVRLLDKN